MRLKHCNIFVAVAVALFALAFSHPASAQFKDKAFTQNYNDHPDSLASTDTTDKMLDFKEIFGGLAHKRKMRIGTMFGTSIVLPGAAQIYNEQYWKLPIFYSGIAAGVASGVYFNGKCNATGDARFRTISTLSFVGAGVFYYASLMDGNVNYISDKPRSAGRATIYSILCPGLGQAYNGEYWKIPIYVGGLVASGYFLQFNRTNYIRFRDIYREANEPGYSGPVSAEQAKYYRDMYRRYRDYSVLALGIVYLLQVIDANVFCYMNDFEVSDNVALNVTPTVIVPQYYAFNDNMRPAPGLSLGLRF